MNHDKVETFKDWLRTYHPILWEKHMAKPRQSIVRPRWEQTIPFAKKQTLPPRQEEIQA